jgi:phage shock protein A
VNRAEIESAAEIERMLRQQLSAKRADLTAALTALERATAERDQWRRQYLELRERVDRLCAQLQAVAEVGRG